jgi:hypothetical protein
MKKPDWSKAPEGAEYWCDSVLVNWYKMIDGSLYHYSLRGARWIASHNNLSFICNLAKRPPSTPIPPLTGEGLPPVGAVIEWTNCENLNLEVVGHYKGAVVAVDPNNPGNIYTGKSSCYRLIRTPEQIAADEREAVILEMERICRTGEFGSGGLLALYDAGYRKP